MTRLIGKRVAAAWLQILRIVACDGKCSWLRTSKVVLTVHVESAKYKRMQMLMSQTYMLPMVGSVMAARVGTDTTSYVTITL